jgi:hypothetical protein
MSFGSPPPAFVKALLLDEPIVSPRCIESGKAGFARKNRVIGRPWSHDRNLCRRPLSSTETDAFSLSALILKMTEGKEYLIPLVVRWACW